MAAVIRPEPSTNRSRRGHAVEAVAAGLVGVVVGAGIGVPHLVADGLTATSVAGTLALAVGIVLLLVGSVALVRSASGWRTLWALPIAFLVVELVLLPLPPALYATNPPHPALGLATPADRGLDAEAVSFPATDGTRLAGWYVPSENGAAVALLHGAGSTRSAVLVHAAVLARHGYGILAFDARGHGESDGRPMDFGWFGDEDLGGAVRYLASRPEADRERIGAVGLSMGAEQAIGAAATDPRIQAVVAEGATARGVAADHARAGNRLEQAMAWITERAADVLTPAGPPIGLREAIRSIAPRPVLLVAAGDVGAEVDAAQWFAAAAPDSVEVWVVPGTGHTDGLETRPEEWEARVVEFLDAALGS